MREDSSSDLSLNTALFWEGASVIRRNYLTGTSAGGRILESH
jgi:hypothetical protein